MRQRKRYSEHKRWHRLRACWWIIRGESVAWNLNFEGGEITARGKNGICFTYGCTASGEPLSAWNIILDNPQKQPD